MAGSCGKGSEFWGSKKLKNSKSSKQLLVFLGKKPEILYFSVIST
jgi:hypothetical protein